MERECSIEEAEQRFMQEIKKLKFQFVLKTHGERPLQAVSCSLFQNEELVAMGGGKGIGKQAELSAKFESLEVITGQVSHVRSSYEQFSLNDIHQFEIPIFHTKIYAELLAQNHTQRDVPLPWIPYQRFDAVEKSYLPAVCSHPFYYRNPFKEDKFDYTNIYLSSTTNGIATGCTRTEALIHGILEVVERDSLSLFMINTFLKEHACVPEIIEIKDLSNHLKEIAEQVIRITGYQLIIYHLPNEADIPVYGALLHDTNLQVPIKGSGASLNAEYAIERALLEALEIYHWDSGNEKGRLSIERVEQWPRLQRCAEFNLQNVRHKSVPFPATDSFKEIHPSRYLEILVERLNRNGFSVYYHETYASENISTVHVIIPEAEDFFSVGMGIVVPLQNRGRRALCAI